jgi:uncharacterized protein
MFPITIIEKYYSPQSEAYEILVNHSRLVAEKAVEIARNKPDLNADIPFVEEAAWLHDIGIFLTHAPSIGCSGDYPYICHGYLGADLLRREGLPRHALVAERHTGTGISLGEIIEQELPLPHRDMRPVSVEEQIVCFADKFYSKTYHGMKTIEEIRVSLGRHSEENVVQFDKWCEMFL